MYYLKMLFVALVASMLTIGLAGWQSGDVNDADIQSAGEWEQPEGDWEHPDDDDDDDEEDEWGDGDW